MTKNQRRAYLNKVHRFRNQIDRMDNKTDNDKFANDLLKKVLPKDHKYGG